MRSKLFRFFNASLLTRLALSAAFAVSSAPMFAQAPHLLDAAEEQRVDTMVKQMTLQQKLDYIGGTGFGVRAVPSVGIPALDMSDGPFGTRSNSGFPSTTYGAGINTAASWDPALAARGGGRHRAGCAGAWGSLHAGAGGEYLPFATKWTQL
jgi:beta-glucosidase